MQTTLVFAVTTLCTPTQTCVASPRFLALMLEMSLAAKEKVSKMSNRHGIFARVIARYRQSLDVTPLLITACHITISLFRSSPSSFFKLLRMWMPMHSHWESLRQMAVAKAGHQHQTVWLQYAWDEFVNLVYYFHSAITSLLISRTLEAQALGSLRLSVPPCRDRLSGC